MELFRNWKQHFHEKKEEEVKRMAVDYITLTDSENRLYIAYQGNPLILLDDDISAGEVMTELRKVRQNYIDGKTQELCLATIPLD